MAGSERSRRRSDESVMRGGVQHESTMEATAPSRPNFQIGRNLGGHERQQHGNQVNVRSGERSRRPSEYHRQGYVTLGQPPGTSSSSPYYKHQDQMPGCCTCCTHCGQVCPTNICQEQGEDAGHEPLWKVYIQRVPWLIGLMMVQSVSSVVLQRYEGLIEANVIIASYLTMLVGGGGNAAVQVVTDIVRRSAKAQSPTFLGTLAREVALSCAIAPTLAVVAYLRVRYLGVRASEIDSFAIAISYCTIVVVAIATAVVVTFTLQCAGKSRLAATGAAPTTQVLVDVLGIIVVCLICMALLGIDVPEDFCDQCSELGDVKCIDASRCNTTRT